MSEKDKLEDQGTEQKEPWEIEFDKKMAEAYKLDAKMDRAVIGGNREPLFRDCDALKVLAKDRDPNNLHKVYAFNKMVKDSGIINHFVLNEKTGEYLCAGITFPSGHYLHLNKNVAQQSVLMLMES